MRIAIVNDMVIAVEALKRALLQAQEHELAWVARTGREAVEHCARDTPDLVLMDLFMPGIDGVEATRRIMAGSPCAIVVVTADMDKHVSKVFEAMGAGALDAVNTPTLERSDAVNGAEILLRKIKTIHQLIGPEIARKERARISPASPAETMARPQLIAIGASAGGPAALAKILSVLPPDIRAAILIVQHVDPQFMAGLAHWLSQQTKLPLRLAAEGDRLEPGVVLLAGKADHLAFISPEKIGYIDAQTDSLYQPSIDIFFHSIQKYWRGDAIGVLLTGMGKDGANGLKHLHDAGCHTIVQDQATSAVFGMPKAAIEMKAASEILPLDKIGPRLISLSTRKKD